MTLSEIVQLLEIVAPPLIDLAEKLFPPGTGASKKTAVTGAATHILSVAGVHAPQELIEQHVEQTLAQMKASGWPETSSIVPITFEPQPSPSIAAPDQHTSATATTGDEHDIARMEAEGGIANSC